MYSAWVNHRTFFTSYVYMGSTDLGGNFHVPTKYIHELHKPAPADGILSHRFPITNRYRSTLFLRCVCHRNTNSVQSQSCFVLCIKLVHVHDTLLDFMPDNKSTSSASKQVGLTIKPRSFSVCFLTSLSHCARSKHNLIFGHARSCAPKHSQNYN
jgi:hypothetical protein